MWISPTVLWNVILTFRQRFSVMEGKYIIFIHQKCHYYVLFICKDTFIHPPCAYPVAGAGAGTYSGCVIGQKGRVNPVQVTSLTIYTHGKFKITN